MEKAFSSKTAYFLAAGCAVLLTLIGRGNFLHVSAVSTLNLWIGVPLLIFSAAAWAISSLPYWDPFHRTAKMTLLAVGVIAIQLFSIPAGKMLLARDVKSAQAYCESLIPMLDEFMAKKGTYPKVQEDIIKEQKGLPRLLRSDRFYWGNRKTFTLAFKDPAGAFNFYEFNSATRRWERLG